MICDYCTKSFVDEDENTLASYLMHLLVTHGDQIEGHQ